MLFRSENAKNSYDVSFIDNNVAPGADFYNYATGGWQKANPLKPEFSRFGSFDQLRENNKEKLKELVEEVASQSQESGSVGQKIADLYNLAMNEERLNNEKAAPVQPFLEMINAISSKDDLAMVMGKLNRIGVFPFFNPFIDADASNSDMNLFQIYQGGIAMGQRDYYLEEDENMDAIRKQYLIYIENLYSLLGESKEYAVKTAQEIFDFEKKLAEASSTTTELRDPVANFNKMSVSEFKNNNKDFNWDIYLKESGFDKSPEVNIGQLKFMAAFNKLIKETDLSTLKKYLAYNALVDASSFLSDDFYTNNFEFFGKTMSGKEEQEARWKRALSTTDSSLGEAVGQMYVQKYFPAEAKERMITLVANLQTALGQRISNLEWMSDDTKEKALEKLSTFKVKIGYPDKWRDYSALNISSDDSYYTNVTRVNAFEWDYMISKSGKPVDKTEWLMSPQTVNAYYNPLSNEICFPAGILQEPFFYLDGDDAINYGAIGVVIGHEMTHGFDDQGRQFDKNGNISDWWTAQDADKFNTKTKVLVDQFDKVEVLPSVFANGTFTLGENIADQGGLLVSYLALQNSLNGADDEMIDGFSNDQRFYLSYAALWAGNIRDEEKIGRASCRERVYVLV